MLFLTNLFDHRDVPVKHLTGPMFPRTHFAKCQADDSKMCYHFGNTSNIDIIDWNQLLFCSTIELYAMYTYKTKVFIFRVKVF